VHSGNSTKLSFDDLFKKKGWNNEYKSFYNDFLSSSISKDGKYGFDKFANIPTQDRKKVKELLSELEKLIKKQ